MAIVNVVPGSAGEITKLWKIPPASRHTNSFIPRGIVTFEGSSSIAAKIAADQTRVQLTLSFSGSFCFALKNFSVRVTSDDQSNDFNNTGRVLFGASGLSAECVATGNTYADSTLKAQKIYTLPAGFGYPLMTGDTDDILVTLADVSADASSAGDVIWFVQAYMYDIEQCNNYQVNTPFPVISR